LWGLTPVIPATWNVEIGGSPLRVSPREKVRETLSQKTSSAWWYMPVIPGAQDMEVGELLSEMGPEKSTSFYLKNN
jgi:hypothetical protein